MFPLAQFPEKTLFTEIALQNLQSLFNVITVHLDFQCLPLFPQAPAAQVFTLQGKSLIIRL